MSENSDTLPSESSADDGPGMTIVFRPARPFSWLGLSPAVGAESDGEDLPDSDPMVSWLERSYSAGCTAITSLSPQASLPRLAIHMPPTRDLPPMGAKRNDLRAQSLRVQELTSRQAPTVRVVTIGDSPPKGDYLIVLDDSLFDQLMNLYMAEGWAPIEAAWRLIKGESAVLGPPSGGVAFGGGTRSNPPIRWDIALRLFELARNAVGVLVRRSLEHIEGTSASRLSTNFSESRKFFNDRTSALKLPHFNLDQVTPQKFHVDLVARAPMYRALMNAVYWREELARALTDVELATPPKDFLDAPTSIWVRAVTASVAGDTAQAFRDWSVQSNEMLMKANRLLAKIEPISLLVLPFLPADFGKGPDDPKERFDMYPDISKKWMGYLEVALVDVVDRLAQFFKDLSQKEIVRNSLHSSSVGTPLPLTPVSGFTGLPSDSWQLLLEVVPPDTGYEKVLIELGTQGLADGDLTWLALVSETCLQDLALDDTLDRSSFEWFVYLHFCHELSLRFALDEARAAINEQLTKANWKKISMATSAANLVWALTRLGSFGLVGIVGSVVLLIHSQYACASEIARLRAKTERAILEVHGNPAGLYAQVGVLLKQILNVSIEQEVQLAGLVAALALNEWRTVQEGLIAFGAYHDCLALWEGTQDLVRK